MTATATYQIFIDWDNDGGLFAGNFEGSLDDWAAAGTTPPNVELSAAFSHLSGTSMEITWTAFTPSATGDTGTEIKFGTSGRGWNQGRFGGGTTADVMPPIIVKAFSNLIVGRQYDLTAWIYVPGSGGQHVQIGIDSLVTSPASTALDAWQQIACTFTATNSQHVIEVTASDDTLGGELTYVDEIMITGPGEDVSARVLGLRTPLTITYGRDTARSLSTVQPGQVDLEIDNRSRDYSPDNPGSVIAGFLTSGKQVLIKAAYNQVNHVMFSGYLTDYVITPDRNSRSVAFTCMDVLSRLNATISTPVFNVLRTGDGVHKILDAIGWPADKRDIDPGATIMQYWSVEGQTGLEALGDLLSSEGPPAIAHVDAANNFVFRDRHHRILYPASISPQATFVDDGPEPQFSVPFSYDIGWKDIVNSIDVSIDQRSPGEVASVFSSTDVIALGAGESRTITASGETAFIEAIPPVAGTDFVVQYGSVNVTLSRDSGQSCDIIVTATSASALEGMNLRARPINVDRTLKVVASDPGSISDNGVVSFDGTMPWAGINDAYAVAAIVLGQRAQRLPMIRLTLNNANEARLNQILSRDLSDRVHVIEDETFTDHPYYIERIVHNINDIGANHTVEFSMERVRTQVSPVFTFDDSTKGFDDGLFGLSGFDDPATVFILDQSNLDTGLLGT